MEENQYNEYLGYIVNENAELINSQFNINDIIVI